MKRILSLDLASSTGWARQANGVIDYGVEKFTRKTGLKRTPDEHEGIIFCKFSKWVNGIIHETYADLIVYERPGHFPSAASAFMACGLRGILYANAARIGVPIVCYAPTSIKKWATGTGRAEKPMMLTAATVHAGETFTSHDAADAYLMLLMHLSLTK